MPYDVPVGNMDKVMEAKEWFERYYAMYPKTVPPAYITLEELKKGGK